MRSLKALGLVFVAALALSAMVASGASAATVTGGPIVHGEDGAGTAALTGAAGIGCGEATYEGTAAGSLIALELEFSSCSAGEAPITVTDNGCAYVLVLGALAGTSAPASANLVCPPSQQVVLHIYTNPAHTTSVCTIEIPPQAGLTGLTVTDQENGHLLAEGEVTGVTNYIAGGCATAASGGALETLNPGNAVLDASITLESEEGLALE